MKTEVIRVDIHTPIMAALDIMKQNNIKRLPVTKNGKFVGLITRAMIRDASPSTATSLSVYELNYLISKMTVGDIMRKDPVTISPDLPVEEAIWLGRKRGIGAFVIWVYAFQPALPRLPLADVLAFCRFHVILQTRHRAQGSFRRRQAKAQRQDERPITPSQIDFAC